MSFLNAIPFRFKSIRSRILFFSSLCVALVSVASSVYLYYTLGTLLLEKARSIHRLNAEAITGQLGAELEKVSNLAVQCASHPTLLTAVERSGSSRTSGLRAQQVMNDLVAASGVDTYLDKIILYNTEGVMIEAGNQNHHGYNDDVELLMASPLYPQLLATGATQPFSLVFTSITPFRDNSCLVALLPVTSGPPKNASAWLYMEVSLEVLTDILDPYTEVGYFFVSSLDGHRILPGGADSTVAEAVDPSLYKEGRSYEAGGDTWRVETYPLSSSGLTLFSCVNESSLLLDSQRLQRVTVIVVACILFIGLALSVILSATVTRPIQRLTGRIKRIAENDFSFDPEIERGSDEIAQIGRVVNEMSLAVKHLLDESQEAGEQKRQIEIAMLQSQVNPHFLYNTLDSIHWMAVIQKNPGIEQMTRSLSNLLKHMAKGYNQKVPLREEIELLNDYLNIQAIRYLDTFDFVNEIDPALYSCRIVKLTLQPLVENAIFHGIEPTGRFGTITLSSAVEGGDILLTVADDGAGMDAAAIKRVLAGQSTHSASSMNGIGVSNVNSRLRLVYGPVYGLSIDSKLGEYTRITVRIPREEGIS